MQKKILVIYYSQSGQLSDILDHFIEPLCTGSNSVETVQVQPAVPYPFPWKGKSFFSVMPDSVLEVKTDLQPFQLKEKRYDLIIFGYQAWFLSPSIPFNSLLNHPEIISRLEGTPVLTITGARNMWISAMESIRKQLRTIKARHIGNIALIDKHANFISFVTILYWMFTGKKDRYLNIFPKPGVAKSDIEHCSVFGKITAQHLTSDNWDKLQENLLQEKSVDIKYNLMFIESKAKRIFTLWAKFIAKRKNRNAWLVAFKYYLIIALFIAAPVILTIDAIFFKPFLSARIKRQKLYYSDVN